MLVHQENEKLKIPSLVYINGMMEAPIAFPLLLKVTRFLTLMNMDLVQIKAIAIILEWNSFLGSVGWVEE